MLRKTTATLLLACLVAAIPTPALAAIKFQRIQYDSPGSDRGTNKSLNAEWVRIVNTGSEAKSLKGWKLRDETGYTYRFRALRLRPGKTVTVHTGRGSDTRRHRYWRMRSYVWNNTGDRATLRNRAGRVVDRCKWSGGATATNC